MADVERQADFLGAVALEPALDFGRSLHRGTADDDAIDAIAQQVVDDRLRTHAAAHLDVERTLRSQPHDDAAVGELAILGAVEVDDVQPVRAQRAITQQQFVRLEVVARFSVEIALEQANTTACTQIDGGNEYHFIKRVMPSGSWRVCARRPRPIVRGETAYRRSCRVERPRQSCCRSRWWPR